MPLVLAFLLLLLPALALGQGRLGGVVQDSVTHQPLAFASVFLANTTLGVTTNEQGKFELAGVPLGRHHLVASYVGYRLAQRTIVVEETTQQVLLRLAPAAQLGEVVVRPRTNQEADYARFKELFIGHTSFSNQCRILNPKDLLLDYDAKTTQLTAAAIKYLEIENAALGYRLKYYGLRLSANFAQHQVAFLGQPLFEEMPSRSKLQQRRWQANRAIAYRGSLRHFLKSVYEDSLTARGFYVRRLRLVPNHALANRDSLKSLLVAEKRRNEGAAEATPPPPWAPEQKGFVLAYFRPLPADSLRHTSADKRHVFLRFTGYVQVDYLREGPDPYFTYLAPISRSRPLAKGQISRLLLLEPGVEITADGQLASPHAFLVDSYWSFEKIGEFLPFDYQLPTSTPGSAAH